MRYYICSIKKNFSSKKIFRFIQFIPKWVISVMMIKTKLLSVICYFCSRYQKGMILQFTIYN